MNVILVCEMDIQLGKTHCQSYTIYSNFRYYPVSNAPQVDIALSMGFKWKYERKCINTQTIKLKRVVQKIYIYE